MFLLNLGYRWNLHTELEAAHGVVVLPQGKSVASLTRTNAIEAPWILLDPQLYLASVDAANCRKICARLAGFPWFGVNGLPAFESDQSTLSEWERSVRDMIDSVWPGCAPQGPQARRTACLSALEFQQNFGCTHILFPTPLVTEREDEAGALGEWLDTCLEIAAEWEMPQTLLATVAVSEAVLNEASFAAGGALETIVDQVTAREGLDGVYIVVAQVSKPAHPFKAPPDVTRAYMHLSAAFGARYRTVVTNFADVAGFACLGAGASAVASGPSQLLRRLSLLGLDDEGGGRAFPHFYSHGVVGEFLTETDLGPVAQQRLLSIVNDRTPPSENLLDELAGGGTAADVPDWAESQNNLSAAQKHFLHRLSVEASRLAGLAQAARRDEVRSWLLTAQANGLLLGTRVPNISPKLAPVGDWLDLLDAAVEG